MLKLVSFLLRSLKGAFALAVVAGVISGVGTSALVAMIHFALNSGQSAPRSLIMAFGALCLALPLSRALSQFMLIKIGQKAVNDVRLGLSRQILSTPLRRLEETGPHSLTAALTDDVMTISVG